MAVRVALGVPVEASLGTTLTRIVPGDGVDVVQVSTTADLYLALDDSLDDGDAVPATERFRIPAGSVWPIELTGTRPLLATTTGTADVSFLGLAATPAQARRSGMAR